MILGGLQTVEGRLVSVQTNGSIIAAVRPGIIVGDELRLDFDNAIVMPGIINSHDHLEFNLYPQLGERTYNNYREWGAFLHGNYQDEIAAIERIPKQLRILWGAYKNLLGGVTTVVNHGERINADALPVHVHQQLQNLHSPGFERKWKLKMNDIRKISLPVAIHAGEGTDDTARTETDALLKWNLFRRKLIAVHGVAMTPSQAAKIHALVWCPQSNYFLLGQTASINALKDHVPILFGTDSTLTGSWDVRQHIHTSRSAGHLTDQELYISLAAVPANLWGLNKGQLIAGMDADLLVIDNKNNIDPLEAALAATQQDILLVMQNGYIRLIDPAFAAQAGIDLKNYTLIDISGSLKYVAGRLDTLAAKLKRWLPEYELPFRLIETENSVV